MVICTPLKRGRDPDKTTPDKCKSTIHCDIGADKCLKFRMARFGAKWKARTPVLAGVVDKSWLGIVEVDGIARIGCIVCQSDSPSTKYGRFEVTTARNATIHNLLLHADQDSHKKAVRRYVGEHVDDPRAAPPREDFGKVLKHMREQRGGHYRGIADVGKAGKTRRMEWCLAESKRNVFKAHVKKSVCASIHQDGTKNILRARLHATTADMETKKGFLGQVLDAGGTAKEITNATLQMVKEFSTHGAGAPPRAASVERDHLQKTQPASHVIRVRACTLLRDYHLPGTKYLLDMPTFMKIITNKIPKGVKSLS